MKAVDICANLTMALAALGMSTLNAATTDVENILDPVLHPYQQFVQANCSEPGDCQIEFPAAAGRTLIRFVSCTFAVTTGDTFRHLTLGSQEANPADFLPFSTVGVTDGLTIYAISTPVYLFVTNGNHPIIDILPNSSTVQALQCTLSGYYN